MNVTGSLYRWHILMREAIGRPLPVLAKQDAVMLKTREEILSRGWFRDNVDYYYLRRNCSHGIGLWFSYIQVTGGQRDIQANVSSALSGLCSFDPEIRQEKVLTTGDTQYSADLDEEAEFWRFLTITTEVTLDLLAHDTNGARHAVLSARLRASAMPSPLAWTQFAPNIRATRTYNEMSNDQRAEYSASFSKLVKGQHWAHFLCNMVLNADPHRAYNGRIPMPEEYWKRELGVE